MTEAGRERSIQVPGSKSIANRALICAALADGNSIVSNCAPGDDTRAMLESLEILGVKTTQDHTTVQINSRIDLDDTQSLQLQTRLAGTTSRFLTALCALRVGQTTIDGYEPLRKRPMTGLHNALSSLGASVKGLNGDGHLPVTVQRGSSWQARIAVDSSTSSQFTSALMMIAPYLPDGLEIELRGEVISRGYLDMTVGVMRAFGAQTEIAGNIIWISPGRYSGLKFDVEPDASSASYPGAAAAITGGQVTIAGLNRGSLQRDVEFLDVLAQMGCEVRQLQNGISLSRDLSRPCVAYRLTCRRLATVCRLSRSRHFLRNRRPQSRALGLSAPKKATESAIWLKSCENWVHKSKNTPMVLRSHLLCCTAQV